MSAYVIGIDFGTLSGRILLVEVKTGAEIGTAVYEYPHGVMTERLSNCDLPGPDWALQDPADYLEVLAYGIPEILSQTRISPEDVIGVGIDFTSCTILPVKADGTPLCFLEEYRDEPHAYVKLWKHHAAQDQANRLNEIAKKRKEGWLSRYGGKISSEWVFPKVWQILKEAPKVYEAADFIVEAADWVVWQLTGQQKRSACTAGYKAIWSKREGYPSEEFFEALDPRLKEVAVRKLDAPILPVGSKAGGICGLMSQKTGLLEGTAVAVANVDAHVTVPAVGITGPGAMLAVIGTSTCHILLGETEKNVPGMCGVTEDGVVPGLFGYEAGQSCVGDHFAWFVENSLPERYVKKAAELGMDLHQYLSELAEQLRPGESGLIALDWWNGNRSVLVDTDVSGMMLGMTLQTKPEEIYRALIEATAYGTRMIVETFRSCGVPVNEFYAAGGISQKNPLAMQIYADVLNMPVWIADCAHGPALGSAIFASVAAGKEAGGYGTVWEASAVMGRKREQPVKPDPDAVRSYERLYEEYRRLHDYFGRGENDVMKRLKSLKLDRYQQRKVRK